jgi:tripartite-type tricarboxylate transporter receptor subunit TctC
MSLHATARRGMYQLMAASVVSAAGLFAFAAFADPVTDFYKGKDISIVIGHSVGSGFTVYARVLARHFGRHMPGHPNIVVQNMVGASGMRAANWLYNVAPKDGTVIGNFSGTVTFDPLLGSKTAKFAPAKFAWIGNIDENISTCGVSKASGIRRFQDLLTKEVLFGASGAAGPFGKFAYAVKNLLGAKIKVVPGYKGSGTIKIAIERGEVQGLCGLPLSTITSFWRDQYKSGDFRIILQLSGKKVPALKGIPHVNDLARSEEDRQVFDLIFGVQVLGRVYVAPPGVPADRRDALRAAFEATMHDPKFLADAAKAKIVINSSTGKEVEAFIARMSASSPAVIERAKSALRPN